MSDSSNFPAELLEQLQNDEKWSPFNFASASESEVVKRKEITDPFSKEFFMALCRLRYIEEGEKNLHSHQLDFYDNRNMKSRISFRLLQKRRLARFLQNITQYSCSFISKCLNFNFQAFLQHYAHKK